MDYLPFIIHTVRDAGDLLLSLRDRGFSTDTKNGDWKNIVTSVDQEVDAYITKKIRTTYPEHALYSEEGGRAGQESAYQWTIDPIDGSSNFARGIPHYAVCVGVLLNGEPLAGAVYNPVTKELFHFEKGRGAFLNEAPIAVSPVKELREAWILFHAGRGPEIAQWGGASYGKLLDQARKTSNLSSTSLDTCFVAAGRVEASIYGTYSMLDNAAALGVLKEAGGIVALPDGSVPSFNEEAQTVIVANVKPLLDEVRALLF